MSIALPIVPSSQRPSSYAPYSSYRQSNVSWLGDIPSHWDVRRIKHGFEVRLGKMLQTEPTTGLDALKPYLRSPNVLWGAIDTTDIKEMWLSPYDQSLYRLAQGDLVVCEGGDVGRAAIWCGELPECYIQNAVHRLRGKAGYLSRFLYYWLFAVKQSGYIDLICNKATIAHLTAEKLREIPLFCPPFFEQRTIVAFLDRETAKIDALIAKKERLIEVLDEKRASLIDHVITHGLNEAVLFSVSRMAAIGRIPQHWTATKLKYIASAITVGIVVTPASYYVDEGVPCLRSLNVKERRIDDNQLVFISQSSHRMLQKSAIYAGDLVVVRTGQPGTAAIVDRRFDGANCIDLIIVRRSPLYDSDFMAYVANSRLAKVQYALGSNGALQQHFNVETAKNLLVPLPPLQEQLDIVARLDQKTGQIAALMEKVREHIDRLREYRTALITAAVTGKIDVREDPA